MPVYSEWDDSDIELPPITTDDLIRWGAVAVVLLLPVLTLWCLSRPVAWVLGRWS